MHSCYYYMAASYTSKTKKELFDKVYREHFKLVKHFSQSYLGDEELARDTAQEVFVSLWSNLEHLEQGKEKSYLLAIAKNKCLNVLKHYKVKGAYSNHAALQIKNDNLNLIALEYTSTAIYKNEVEGILAAAISNMPDIFASTFNLSRFRCLKNDEIAKKQGISVRTVEYRLQKATSILRTALKDYIPVITWILINYYK